MHYHLHLTQEQLILQLDKEVEDTLQSLDYKDSFYVNHRGVLHYSTATWDKSSNPTDFFYGDPDTDEPYAPRLKSYASTACCLIIQSVRLLMNYGVWGYEAIR